MVIHCDILITGDFNIHFEPNSAPGVVKLHHILEEHGRQRYVMLPTHKRGHTLDLVISRRSDTTVSTVAIEHTEISDHHSVTFKLKHPTPYNEAQIKEIQDFR